MSINEPDGQRGQPMTVGSVGSIVESIRFERERVPCDPIALASGAYDHERWRYTIRWVDPDGADHVETEFRCWHPLCDTSPWCLLKDLSRRPADVLLTSWIRPGRAVGVSAPAVAVAYVLRLYGCDAGATPLVVARIGITSQWEDPRFGNHHGELFSRRYYAAEGSGVYPSSFTDT